MQFNKSTTNLSFFLILFNLIQLIRQQKLKQKYFCEALTKLLVISQAV